MRQLILLLEMIASMFLFSCNSEKYKEEDFVGIWKSNDGAIIQLKSDFSFIANSLDFSKIYYPFYKCKNKKTDCIGKWKYTMNSQKERVIYVLCDVDNKQRSFSFYISGKGVLGNKPPWDLYVDIGDPDDMNRYVFTKEQGSAPER